MLWNDQFGGAIVWFADEEERKKSKKDISSQSCVYQPGEKKKVVGELPIARNENLRAR